PNAPITWGPVVSGTPGSPAARAALSAIESFARGVRGVGGVILLGPDGTPGFAFNTPRMARGYWVEGMGEPWIDTEPA
ncbi:MAG: isoaspartyl peptidase/L-asparaginase, partial [Candidatus Eisenbacteria bacterium]|nr:isoaspartyl peptidase/L-asparaginase [Candidatus Eisenbacteria bacterium]